jgi:hypothetical protein
MRMQCRCACIQHSSAPTAPRHATHMRVQNATHLTQWASAAGAAAAAGADAGADAGLGLGLGLV